MIIPGVAPGEKTQRHLAWELVVVRAIGAVGVLLMLGLSYALDQWMTRFTAVQISTIDILIVISTLQQASQVVRIFAHR